MACAVRGGCFRWSGAFGLFDCGQTKDTMAMHFMKNLSFALSMLSLVCVSGLATADEVPQGKALCMQSCS